MPSNMLVVPYEGYRFYFKYQDDHPDLLHIWVRGLFEPEDAIEVWFEGEEEVFNEKRGRFETYTADRGIYWLWLNEEQGKILIISCFKRQ